MPEQAYDIDTLDKYIVRFFLSDGHDDSILSRLE